MGYQGVNNTYPHVSTRSECRFVLPFDLKTSTFSLEARITLSQYVMQSNIIALHDKVKKLYLIYITYAGSHLSFIICLKHRIQFTDLKEAKYFMLKY